VTNNIINFPEDVDLVKDEEKVGLVCPTCESPYWRVFEAHVMQCSECGQDCYMELPDEELEE
tara:strand:- start:1573 stop:1758 length:186 start_codon:yes stop_codon:yes gene_type:complete